MSYHIVPTSAENEALLLQLVKEDKFRFVTAADEGENDYEVPLDIQQEMIRRMEYAKTHPETMRSLDQVKAGIRAKFGYDL